MDSGGDDWFALDKLHHFLFCFSLTLVFSTAAARIRHPFIRSHRVCLASLCSLSAGAAKEVADELGFFHSSGASVRDFSADILGTVVAHLGLLICHRLARPSRAGAVHGASLV